MASEATSLRHPHDGSMAEITCFSRCQGPLQAFLRPGQWCFGVRALRQGSEAWACRSDTATLFRALEDAVAVWQAQGLLGTRKVRLGKSSLSQGFIRIENYTQSAEWLDVVEFHVTAESQGSVEVRVKSFSSGEPCNPSALRLPLHPSCCGGALPAMTSGRLVVRACVWAQGLSPPCARSGRSSRWPASGSPLPTSPPRSALPPPALPPSWALHQVSRADEQGAGGTPQQPAHCGHAGDVGQ
jgi:hypothetical protein